MLARCGGGPARHLTAPGTSQPLTAPTVLTVLTVLAVLTVPVPPWERPPGRAPNPGASLGP